MEISKCYLNFFHYPDTEFSTFARRLLCPQWMEHRRKHTTIHNHASPGVREETALHGSWDFWQWVSGWMWLLMLGGCGVLSQWRRSGQCGIVAPPVEPGRWLTIGGVRRVWSMISEELPSFQGFPVGSLYLLPAGSEMLQLSFFIIVGDYLSQMPAGGPIVMGWGVLAVSADASWTNENILGQMMRGEKSEKINLDESDYTESMYLCVTFLEHLSV